MSMSMGKKRIVNSESFISACTSVASSRKRSKVPKTHQKLEKLIDVKISSKIMNEALSQQKEIADEEKAESNPSRAAFAAVRRIQEEEDDDIDDFDGNFGGRRQFDTHQEDINEEDEKLLESFFVTNARPQRTLAGIIIKKIKDNDDADLTEKDPPIPPEMDPRVIELYKGVGKFMSGYTIGKMPKAFKLITSMGHWKDMLYLTEPEKWSPNAMYQATRIFVSNLKEEQVIKFCKYVLLPQAREDIRKHKKLHFSLYQALKKSLYKPGAFYEGILIPLCESGTCSIREAVILGSILQKCSIPANHSGAALKTLAKMEYCGATSYFMKILLEKNYCLPYKVIDAMVAHFKRVGSKEKEEKKESKTFQEIEERAMPVIWHQTLLAFVQRYKYELLKEDKDGLKTLFLSQDDHLGKEDIERLQTLFLWQKDHLVREDKELVQKVFLVQKHHLITREILNELEGSRSRGEKEDLMVAADFSSVSTINKPIQEDSFDIPQVPMEED